MWELYQVARNSGRLQMLAFLFLFVCFILGGLAFDDSGCLSEEADGVSVIKKQMVADLKV